MNPGPDLLRTLSSMDWTTLGRKNSSIYRKELMTGFEEAGFSPDERFMVSFLFSISKSKYRALREMDNYPNTLKATTWFPKVRMFIETNLTQRASDAGPTKKFQAVNILSTHAGLDLLCWVTWSKYNDIVPDTFFGRTTAPELLLDDKCQGLAKEGYKRYWDDVVKNRDQRT